MIVFVGSDNPVKLNAVRSALSSHFSQAKIFGLAVPSGVGEQPMTDDETRQGALNRAKNVLSLGQEIIELGEIQTVADEVILGVGLEGGVFEKKKSKLWTTVWACVVDQSLPNQKFEANGARFQLPQVIAKPILAGEEMGPVLSRMFDGDDIKRKQGGIGIVTRNFVTRTEEYAGVVKLAFGLWHGRDWEKQLKIKNKQKDN